LPAAPRIPKRISPLDLQTPLFPDVTYGLPVPPLKVLKPF
jgi:hypothetical protein